MGRSVSTGEFAEICLALASRGVENINIVTGTHAAPALADGLAAARKQGLVLPVLWNSSGYETGAALERVSNFVDVYLPDLKTLDPEIARRWFHAADYPQKADRALRAMLDARGELRYDGRGVLVSGVIIRHLVIPGELYATRDVIRWFARNARGRALFSLMTQYTPPKAPSGENGRDAPPDRHLNQNEYDALLSWLDEYGVDDGFLQEPVRNSLWLPDFNRVNPFSSTLSVPVWHWKTGFAVS